MRNPTHEEMADLVESMDNALEVLRHSERDKAKGRKTSPEDLRLWNEARTFVAGWRRIARDVVVEIIGREGN